MYDKAIQGVGRGLKKAIGGIFKRIRNRRRRKGKKILLPFLDDNGRLGGSNSMPVRRAVVDAPPANKNVPPSGDKAGSDTVSKLGTSFSSLPVWAWVLGGGFVFALVRDFMTKNKRNRWLPFMK